MKRFWLGLILLSVLVGGAWAQFAQMPVRWKANIRCSYLTLGDGTLELRACEGYLVSPDCLSTGLADAPSGALCYDSANQRIRFKDGRGEWSM